MIRRLPAIILIFLLSGTTAISGQRFRISEYVGDKEGEKLPGVSIMAEPATTRLRDTGSTRAVKINPEYVTISGTGGNYSLSLPKGVYDLSFSYVGSDGKIIPIKREYMYVISK